MQTSTPIIDLHVHSTLRPYGNSFYPNNYPTVSASPACIWFSDHRTRTDVRTESVLGICRYRQSDFTSLTDGQVRVVCVSLYPIEKEFFSITRWQLRFAEVGIAEFASMFGKVRIQNIRQPNFSYFEDLCKEYDFLCCLSGNTKTNARTYQLIPDAAGLDTVADLLVIPSFEGCHSFADGNNLLIPEAWTNMERNVGKVKSWASPPLFVTFAHHFYNGLCTHAKSLFEFSGKLLDQKAGMRNNNEPHSDNYPPISETGRKLIDLLLDTKNGRRILIDVKHMSKEARNAYYQILKTSYATEKIPVIYSHGAFGLDEPLDINLNAQDLKMIYETDGIIGLEIDQRILGYNSGFLRSIGNLFRSKEKKLYNDTTYFFRQIIAIGEFAYKSGYTADPWKCIALGSDYDGIINPLDSYPDATSLSKLYARLIDRMAQYMKHPVKVIPNKPDVDAADIIYNIMYKNAHDFITRNYKA